MQAIRTTKERKQLLHLSPFPFSLFSLLTYSFVMWLSELSSFLVKQDIPNLGPTISFRLGSTITFYRGFARQALDVLATKGNSMHGGVPMHATQNVVSHQRVTIHVSQ